MAEKTTPKEIPLHEIVLEAMFQANKERPAELTPSQVYSMMGAPNISEIKIVDVLKWLVTQKQVEVGSGKYSLDRYEFLEQRKKDRIKNGEEVSQPADTPLHDVILQLMFDASSDQPAKLTQDDLFWKVSDPKVHEGLLVDVLNWLVNQGRIEYLSGKYFLDRIEFQDQRDLKEASLGKKTKEPTKKPTKKAPEKLEPKKVAPPAPKEVPPISEKEPTEKATLESVKEDPLVEKPAVKSTPTVKPVKKKEPTVEEVKEVKTEVVKEQPAPTRPKPVQPASSPPKQKVKEKEPIKEVITEPVVEKPSLNWRKVAAIIATIAVVFSLYLLMTLSSRLTISDEENSIIFKLFLTNGAVLAILLVLLFKRD